jgi:hypothetical protein
MRALDDPLVLALVGGLVITLLGLITLKLLI